MSWSATGTLRSTRPASAGARRRGEMAIDRRHDPEVDVVVRRSDERTPSGAGRGSTPRSATETTARTWHRGMQKVVEKLSSTEQADAGAALKTVAMTLISTVGGAAGPLYGTLFLQLGSALAGHDERRAARATPRRGARPSRASRLAARPSRATRRWSTRSSPRSRRSRTRPSSTPASGRRRPPPSRGCTRRRRWSRVRGARATSASAAPGTRTPARPPRTT